MNRARGLGRRGSPAVEFALVAPLLGLLALAAIDAALVLRAAFRLDRTATELAIAMSGHPTGDLSAADVRRFLDGPAPLYFAAAQAIAGESMPVTSDPGVTIVTLLVGGETGNAGRNRIVWQCRRGSPRLPSRFGDSEAFDPLPDGARLPPGAAAVVVEVATEMRLWRFSRPFLEWFGVGGVHPTAVHGFAMMPVRRGALMPEPGMTVCR